MYFNNCSRCAGLSWQEEGGAHHAVRVPVHPPSASPPAPPLSNRSVPMVLRGTNDGYEAFYSPVWAEAVWWLLAQVALGRLWWVMEGGGMLWWGSPGCRVGARSPWGGFGVKSLVDAAWSLAWGLPWHSLGDGAGVSDGCPLPAWWQPGTLDPLGCCSHAGWGSAQGTGPCGKTGTPQQRASQ